MIPEQQEKRLEILTERLTDEFLIASDPENWTGSGIEPKKMTPDVRGARNWDLRTCNQVGALLMRTLTIRRMLKQAEEGLPAWTDQDDLNKEVKHYEQEANKILKRLTKAREG